MQTSQYQYIIVGAGIAGLVAAAILAQNKKQFIILEASDRYGGRIWSRRLGDIMKEDNIDPKFDWITDHIKNTNIQYGATWIADQHTFVQQIIKNYGIKIYEQFWEGKASLAFSPQNILQYNDLDEYYRKLHGSKIRPFLQTMKNTRETISDLLALQQKGDEQAHIKLKKIITQLDSISAFQWILNQVKDLQLTQVLASQSVSLQCVDLKHFSALQLLANQQSSFVNLKFYMGLRVGNIDGYRISGGTSSLIQAVYTRLTKALKNNNKSIDNVLRLQQPVSQVINHNTPATVLSRKGTIYKCQRVIMAVPMATAGRIRYSNISPSKKLAIDNQLYCNMTRMPVVFKTPWWRSYHSGYTLFVQTNYEVVQMIDISPQNLSCGILAFVFTADGYDRWKNSILSQCKGLTGEALKKKQQKVNLRKSIKIIADVLLKGNLNHPNLKEAFAFAKTLSVLPYIRSTYEATTAPFVGTKITNLKQNYLDAEESDQKNITFIGADFTPQHCGYMQGALRITHQKIQALVAQGRPLGGKQIPRSMM